MAQVHESTVEMMSGFKVFILSAFAIYFAIALVNAIPNVNFPISTDSGWYAAFIGSAFVTFAAYLDKK